MDLIQMGKDAVVASRQLVKLSSKKKEEILAAVAEALTENAGKIAGANKKDMEKAEAAGMTPALLDRLKMDEDRVAGMADGVRQVSVLDDPIGNMEEVKMRPNGLRIGKMRVPIGVIGMIYESRPNVTVDAFAICFKTGNACILRGGSDSIETVVEIGNVIRDCLKAGGVDPNCVQIMEDTDRKYVTELLHLNDYVDLIIPRGSERLINHVVENSTVPVIKTGTGNCHVYVDESADLEMAVNIIENAKTQRIGVCNACESVLVHEAVVEKFTPLLAERLVKSNVEMRADEKARSFDQRLTEATEEDWGKEYLDYIISIKTVASVDEAIDHINKYGTGHSETIITKDYDNSGKFLNYVDAACVYVNASSRFSDGGEFGFGAEIGISTQKIHARGPMGLNEMTSYKYVIYGNGQIR